MYLQSLNTRLSFQYRSINPQILVDEQQKKNSWLKNKKNLKVLWDPCMRSIPSVKRVLLVEFFLLDPCKLVQGGVSE